MRRSAPLALLLLSSPAFASRVVVVQSDDLDPYTEPATFFAEALGEPVTLLNLHGRKGEQDAVAERLVTEKPEVVFALGAKAAWTARQALPTTPIVYASVLDPERYGIDDEDATGISATVPPAIYLSQLAGFFPEIHTIGVLQGPLATDTRVEEMQRAASFLGLELVVREADSTRSARKAFNQMAPDVDALWLQPDREMLTADLFRVLTEESRRQRLPLLVETDNMVRAGALFAVVPDPEALGLQAVAIVHRILAGEDVEGEAPADALVVLNVGTAKSAQIPFDPLLLDFVDVVVE